ncbi:MAG: helix-turn-helix transcriptional regulator [Bacteroidales bacterium]|nr:helix-turn-helix transcriptional regulator [Bacteroidales bacterium]
MKPTNLYQRALLDIPDDVRREVALSYAVADRIYDLMKSAGMTQKEFAKKIGKSESEVSVWLSGGHNFTLRTLAKVSSVLGEDIVAVPMQR